MIYRWLADFVLLLHFSFLLFVVCGGFAVLRRPRLAWVHLPAALWGVAVELFAWGCPLTLLENHWRRLGGAAGYTGGFIDHYLAPLVYPEGLNRTTQIGLGLLALAINLVFYGLLVARRGKRNRQKRAGP